MSTGVKRYDFYRKAIDGLQTKSSVGGLISLIGGSIIIILVYLQTSSFLSLKTSTTLTVRAQMDSAIPTHLDISFFHLSCENVDIHFENTKSKPVSDVILSRTPLPSVDNGISEGCRVDASFNIYPGEGNFHIALSRTNLNFGMHNHLYSSEDLQHFNCSHMIHSLSFGSSIGEEKDTLSSYEANASTDFNHVTYFLKLIPVDLVSVKGVVTSTYQYSVTEYTQRLDSPSFFSRVSPGVFFKYQLTPLSMKKQQYRTGFLQFYTTLCSIIGGVITVSGIVQALLTHTVIPAKRD